MTGLKVAAKLTTLPSTTSLGWIEDNALVGALGARVAGAGAASDSAAATVTKARRPPLKAWALRRVTRLRTQRSTY